MIDPIFKEGTTLLINGCKCDIQKAQFEKEQWKYFICNRYSAYGSGWLTEDELIARKPKLM